MSARHVFSEAELDQLRRFPAINRAELIKHFTLTAADGAFLAQFCGPTSKLGATVQLCALPWLGFVPDGHHHRTARGGRQAVGAVGNRRGRAERVR